MYEIYHANCIQYLRQIPTQSIDFICTDSPYNLRQYSTGNLTVKGRAPINNDIAEWDVNFDPKDIQEDFIRVLKPTGNIFAFCSYNLIGRWHELFDPIFDTFHVFVWHKTNPTPKFRKAGFLNSCEFIFQAPGLKPSPLGEQL